MEACRLQQSGDELAADAVVGGDVDALMAEVVGHGQQFDAPAVDQAGADKVHAPRLIDRTRWRARPARALSHAPLAHGELGLGEGAIDPACALIGMPASVCLRNPMICSSLNLLFMSAILLKMMCFGKFEPN